MEENNEQEKFVFWTGEKGVENKAEIKRSVGYFQDAFSRFRKNKASLAALIIILLIIAFSLFTPVFTGRLDDGFMDSLYAKKGARNLTLKKIGLADGGIEEDLNERALINVIAIGVGASDALPAPNYQNGVSRFDAENSKDKEAGNGFISIQEAKNEYLPLLKIKSKKIKNGRPVYKTRVDAYLKVGFVYLDVEREEYERILEYQASTGYTVVYPLIANNEYSFDITDGNFWYKTTSKGEPILLENGEERVVSLDENMRLQDNYLRNAEGQTVYYTYSGGGNLQTAQYRIRVLYYNYYRFKNGFEPQYLFGTDSQGYDLSLRLAKGIRLSLLVAFCVSALNLVIGTLYGAAEGYFGGAVDLIMERVADVLSGVPFIVTATLFQIHLAAKVGVIASLLFAFVLTGWIGTARRVRTQFYRYKTQEYVMAAKTLGAKSGRIIWKHIFPNALGTIITASVFVIPNVIFQESMLSFLGIVNLGGVGSTSLGTLLSEASNIWVNYPHLMIFPAIIISLLMVCFNLFGNGLRDALNPSLRGVE